MDMGLSGRSVVVTGGGAGIGLGIVAAFAAEGARVVAADLDPAAAVAAGDGRVVGVTVDLSTADGPATAVQAAVDGFGAVDVLVNNVGICPPRGGFLEVTDADWIGLAEINLLSVVRSCRAAIPHMLERGGGAIVSIASEAGHQPAPFFVDYSVTKGAIPILSKAIANEFADRGIRANTVSPGPIRTPAWGPDGLVGGMAKEWGVDLETAITRFLKQRGMPMARLGAPEDVAAAVLFLASDRARQVTGSDYRVDGGQIATVY
jgi:NAD(P)-dependent dehydrogenase (short-subunit alcohol dehydrogenase family)